MFGNKCLIANGGLGTKEALKGTEKTGLTASLNKLLRCSPSFSQIKWRKADPTHLQLSHFQFLKVKKAPAACKSRGALILLPPTLWWNSSMHVRLQGSDCGKLFKNRVSVSSV